jgi:hypothetical protein
MTDDRDDDVDPSDWLASQFGEGQEAAPPAATPPPAVTRPPVAAPPPAVIPPPTPPAASSGGGFPWGLTPGGTPQPPAEPPAEPPVTPPAPTATPDPPTQPAFPALTEQYGPPTEAYTPPPLIEPDLPPTAAFTFNPAEEFPAVDRELEGVTEAFAPHSVGLPDPVDEGLEASALDSLFGDHQFREYADEPLISPLPPRASSELVRVEGPRVPAARAPIPKLQKTLMWVAGGLVAALALVALFALGTRISHLFGPAPAVIVAASPTPSASPGAIPLGPVAPGDYQWDSLLGGECLEPYESPWQDRYTVVECTALHHAQMVHRGTFDDPADVAYPGADELQKRINLLCTAPTIIDYSVASTAHDIQLAASFAIDADDWDAGNRTYYCFANRSSGEALTASIAVPQVAPPVATPAP